jgi:4-amino-4-deoxy-L-arabinose transferase-like glycosyltransferase
MNLSSACGRLADYLATRSAALRRRPWWELAGLGAIIVLTAFMYTWALSQNGTGNAYYAAAVKSGSLSWKAFLFGSLDPGNFITVDKTPAAFWVPELFVRVFGFSSWSILVPQALAGVASVLILYRLVRRWQGEVSALIAALAFALTPVALLMFRFNNPDALLTLLLLLATWAFWSALEKGSGWRLAGAGAWVGLAFLTKMFEAFLVLPAFVLVYLVCAKPRVWRRLLHLLGALAAMVVAGGWWVLLAQLWPAASRPYIGGSTDNSVLDLILSRTAGYTSGGGIDGAGGATLGGLGGGGDGGGGPNFAGSTGILRMFNEQLGGQISWLLPLALLGLLAGLWTTHRTKRTDLKRAGYLLWGLWTVVIVLVFSFAGGVLHPYYAIVMAPGIAALVGAGGVALWRLGRDNRWFSWVLPAAIIGSSVWSAILLQRTADFAPGLGTAVIVLGSCGAVAVMIALLKPRPPRWVTAVAGVAAAVLTGAALLAGPFAYDLSTISHSVSGSLAAAGPASDPSQAGPGNMSFDGPDASGNPQATADAGLIAYLEANKGAAKYLVAVQSSNAATPLILATDEPVMAMGGFNGGDPAPTLEQFKAMVAAGEIRYVLVGSSGGSRPGNMPPGFAGPSQGIYEPGAPGVAPAAGDAGPGGLPGGQGMPGRGSSAAIEQYVLQTGRAISADEYGGASGGGTLYYLGD